MCELLGVSSQSANRPIGFLRGLKRYSLWHNRINGNPGHQNLGGWGIGYFSGRPVIEKDCRPAIDDPKYELATHRAVGRVILAHIRDPSDPTTISSKNNQPFCLSINGKPWIFAHNGTLQIDYETKREKLESRIDSAMMFEYFHDSLEGEEDIFKGLKKTISEFPYQGTINFMLTDGSSLFVHKDGRHRNSLYACRDPDLPTTLALSTEPLFEASEIRPISAGILLRVENGELTENANTSRASKPAPELAGCTL